MIKVIIADDDELIREGLKRIIDGHDDISVIALAANGSEALELCRRNRPDVVLMDVRMPVMDGIEATRLIKQYDRSIKILILTLFNEEESVLKAIEYECDGYLLKGLAMEEFIAAVKNTYRGLNTFNHEVHGTIRKHYFEQIKKDFGENTGPDDLQKLTEREIDIVRLVTAGKKNSEIAQALCISDGHVRNQITNIMEKLSLRNSKELAVWGARRGL